MWGSGHQIIKDKGVCCNENVQVNKPKSLGGEASN